MPDAPGLLSAGMMVTVRVRRLSRLAVDVAVSVAAALITAAGSRNMVAAWLPHIVIVPLAVGQGLLLLARRRAPMAVLAATTLVGVFMIAVGYPSGPAGFGTWCAAYALAVYGRRARSRGSHGQCDRGGQHGGRGPQRPGELGPPDLPPVHGKGVGGAARSEDR